jgi:hypothetical protein
VSEELRKRAQRHGEIFGRWLVRVILLLIAAWCWWLWFA